jgi:hypothetical protein
VHVVSPLASKSYPNPYENRKKLKKKLKSHKKIQVSEDAFSLEAILFSKAKQMYSSSFED